MMDYRLILAKEKIERLEAENDRLRKLMKSAIGHLKTQPPECLGRDNEGGWYYRDEMIDRFEKAIK